MAIIDPRTVNIRSAFVCTWSGMTTDDVGLAQELVRYPDKTVTVLGDFGSGATVTIQGSDDGTNWFTLTDHADDPLIFTGAGIGLIAQNPRYVRPSVADGTSPDLTVNITVTTSRA